jgi:hypothetical protein
MTLDILSEPRVLLIDDVQEEIEDIRLALNERSIPNEFVNVDIENIYHREFPLESVELIFLDLNFNKGFNAQIIPELCVQIIKDAVKEGKEYYLVIWSKDADESKEVLDLLSLYGISPVKSILRKKGMYLTKDGYDIDRLFHEINDEFSNVMQIEEIEGQILDIEEDCVIIDCLLDNESRTFQKRRFEILPFKNIKNLSPGSFITIRIITKPGSKLYEFYNNNSKELENIFSKDHFFDGIDENSFK